MQCDAACWKIKRRIHATGVTSLLPFVVITVASVVVALVCKIFVAIEADILANVDADEKIIAWHISRKYQVFVNLLNELGQISFFEFPFQNKRAVNGGRSKMNINCTESIITLKATAL